MIRVLQNSIGDVWFDVISRPYSFATPFEGSDYALLLVINDTNISEEEQSNLSDKLVATGCRYAVCTGHECSSWDDSIDYAFIFTDSNFNPPDEKFVMTTWHTDEEIEDVINFFRWGTNFDDFVPSKFLVLFVGESVTLKNRVLPALEQSFSLVANGDKH